MVLQTPAWQEAQDLEATHQKVDQEFASLFPRNQGLDIYESLRLLNWTGTPPSQPMVACNQYSERLVHVFGAIAPDSTVEALLSQLGLRVHSFSTDFFELRVAVPETVGLSATLSDLADKMSSAFSPMLEPEVIQYGILPSCLRQKLRQNQV